MCGERGVALAFLTEHGRFLARVQGPVSGNVLVRRQQYRWADNGERVAAVARTVVLGKIANSRTVLLRAARLAPHWATSRTRWATLPSPHPGANVSFVDFLGTSGPKNVPQSAPRRQSIETDSQQVVDLIGGGGWTRTSDLRKDRTTRKKNSSTAKLAADFTPM